MAWQGQARHGFKVEARRITTMADLVTGIGDFWTDYTLTMLLEGITPFLQNNPAGMSGKTSEDRFGKEKIYVPDIEAEKASYRRGDGSLGFPACAVRKCLITAATGLKIGKRYAATVLPEIIGHFPPLEGDELFPFEDKEGNPIRTYEIDIRRAIRGKQGVLVSRPKIWPWRLRCTLKMTVATGTDIAPLQQGLLQVANKAGQYPGLGDGRPEKIKGKGLWFGKFKVIEMAIEPISD